MKKQTESKIEKAQQQLSDELNDAIAAEELAKTALEDAQFVAFSDGTHVPGALIDALETAKRRRVAAEGALASASRAADAEQEQSQQDRRERRTAEIVKCLSAFADACDKTAAAVEDLAKTGAGGRALSSLNELLGLTSGVSASLLTPQGWSMVSTLGELRSKRPEGVLHQLVMVAMDDAMQGKPSHVLTRYAEALRADIVGGVAAQPETWPAV